jgi:hypothetical protein
LGEIQDKNQLILIQKIGNSAKNTIITQCTTQTINQALVKGQKKSDKKSKIPQDTVNYKLGK